MNRKQLFLQTSPKTILPFHSDIYIKWESSSTPKHNIWSESVPLQGRNSKPERQTLQTTSEQICKYTRNAQPHAGTGHDSSKPGQVRTQALRLLSRSSSSSSASCASSSAPFNTKPLTLQHERSLLWLPRLACHNHARSSSPDLTADWPVPAK